VNVPSGAIYEGMGCACCVSKLDVIAPSHKPYVVPPGGAEPSSPSTCSKSSQSALPAVRPPTEIQASKQERPPTKAEVCKDQQVEPRADASDVSPKDILEEGSLLQGLQLLPWSEEDLDVAGNFGLEKCGNACTGTSCFEDADGLPQLSKRQREALHSWRRLPDVIRAVGGADQPEVLCASPSSRSICQGLVGDCSFLAALSVLAEYEQNFKEPVLSRIIHPRGKCEGHPGPVYNKYGQYGCRLFLNGTSRKVIVDDRVPVKKNGQLLCAHSAQSNELWVTLLEKSFAKIMGSSYDMQGSNPGTDVFHLTGWVPESIPLAVGNMPNCGKKDGKIQGRMDAWNEVFKVAAEGCKAGHCIVCLGTSQLADAAQDAEAQQMGHIEGVSVSSELVAHHAYPVLDCQQVGPYRLLHLKNPWGRLRWEGRFSPGHPSWKEIMDSSVCGGDQGLIKKFRSKHTTSPTSDDGHFWIEWRDVLEFFSHLYLSWAPDRLGLSCIQEHARWDSKPHFSCSALPDDTHITAFNPQFRLHLQESLPEESCIWILLSRHVNIRAELATRYVAAHVYDGSSRVSCPDAPLEQGVYSNGECALVKLQSSVAKGEKEFIIVVSQHAVKEPFNFTLQVFTGVPAGLTPLPPLIPPEFLSGGVHGSWTQEAAGGCSNNLWKYFQNPQWRIEVPDGEPADVFMFLECPSEHSVNIRVFQGGVARPEALRHASSSGPYRQGCCFLRCQAMERGSHIVVVSTFQPGVCTNYRLAWHSSRSLTVAPQPHPFAVPLPQPLQSTARKIPPGRHVSLQIRSAQVPALMSARLQTDWKDGKPPSLRLQQVRATSQVARIECEFQKATYAESYFAFSGSTVLLRAELEADTGYVLEGFAPEDKQWKHAALYITSDRPLVLDEDAEGIK